ncbi:hypothetical protein [Nannocystis pusilla]|uniref:hypothetical protein n=1 Tax=Nannocystis pusilla TaxID=889268 RepID=UPI003DA41807
MIIDLTCQKCEATFELNAQALIDGTEQLKCPHCAARAPADLARAFVAALTELRAQVAALDRKFLLSVTFESPSLADLDDLGSEDDGEG